MQSTFTTVSRNENRTKLFQALLSDCINNDMQSLLVWVVTNNPSKSFMKNLTLKN